MLPLPPHNIILFELDLNLSRLLQFLSDLKSTILDQLIFVLSFLQLWLEECCKTELTQTTNSTFIPKRVLQ